MATKVGDLYAILRIDSTQFRAGLTKAGTALGAFDQMSDKLWRKVGQVAKVALAGIVAGLTLSIKAAADFQAQMAEVSTMLDETTMPLLEDMERGVLELSEAYGEGTQTLTRGLYDILSASVPAAVAMDVLEVSAMAAKAGLVDTGVAADALTTLINAFGASATEADYFADLLFTTVKLGKTTMQELAPSIGGVATIASQAGITMEEVSASLAIMTRNGISTDKAVTFLRSTLVSMIDPSEEAAETAQAFGVDISAAGIKAEGFGAIMDKLSALDPETLSKIFPNIRALQGVLSSSGEIAEELEKITRIMAEGSPMAEAFEKNTDTLNFTFSQLMQTVKNTAIAIGNDLVPSIGELIKGVMLWVRENRERIVTFFTDFYDGIVLIVETAIKMKEVIIGVGVGLGGLMIANKVAQAIKALNLALAAGAGPIGWIAAGIAVLVTGFLKLRKVIREAKNEKELVSSALAGDLKTVEEYQAALDTFEKNTEVIKAQENHVAALRRAKELLSKEMVRGTVTQVQAALSGTEIVHVYEEWVEGLISTERLLQAVNSNLEMEEQKMHSTTLAADEYNDSLADRETIMDHMLTLQKEITEAEEADKDALRAEFDARLAELAEIAEAEAERAAARKTAAEDERQDIADTAEAERIAAEELEDLAEEEAGWRQTEFDLRVGDLADYTEKKAARKKVGDEELEEDKQRAIDKKTGIVEQERLITAGLLEEKEQREKDREQADEAAAAAQTIIDDLIRAARDQLSTDLWDTEMAMWDDREKLSDEGLIALEEYLADTETAYDTAMGNIKDIIFDALGPLGNILEDFDNIWIAGESNFNNFKNVLGSVVTELGPMALDMFENMGESLATAGREGATFSDNMKAMVSELWQNLPKILFAVGVQMLPINFAIGLAMIGLSGLGAFLIGVAGGTKSQKQIEAESANELLRIEARLAAEGALRAISDRKKQIQDDEIAREKGESAILRVTDPEEWERLKILSDANEFRSLGVAESDVSAWLAVKMADWVDKWTPKAAAVELGFGGMAAGGIVGGKSGLDRNLAMLTSGEFVVNKESTEQNAALLEAINSGGGMQISPVVAPIHLDGRVVGEVMIEFMENEASLGRLALNVRSVRSDV